MRTITIESKISLKESKRNKPLAIYIGTITMIAVTYSLVLFLSL